MRLSPLPLALLLVLPASLVAAAPQDRTPAGVAPADWQGIKAAYEKSRHAIEVQADGSHLARNPRQQWSAEFDGEGFTVRADHGAWSWGLELEEVSGMPLAGRPQASRNDSGRLSYRWNANLTEWFIHDSRGLEQGWTLNQRPEAAGAGPLRLDFKLRGNLAANVSGSARDLALCDASGAKVLGYDGLKAWDADGKLLEASFSTADGGLSLTVEDRGARYPLTIDPLIQADYLKASNPDYGDRFGHAVAISGDTVVVGAIGESSSTTGVDGDQANNFLGGAGAAYIFVRNSGVWTQQAYLKPSNPGAQNLFGIAVAISGDTVVVGAKHESSNATGVNGFGTNTASSSGAAYVFVRSGGAWSQQAYLKASNTGAGDSFGSALAISGDMIVVGAEGEDSNATGMNGNQFNNTSAESGAAYVFTRSSGSWSQLAYLKAFDTQPYDAFGTAVAISEDTIAIGAYAEDSGSTGPYADGSGTGANNSGAVYLYSRSGNAIGQGPFIKPSNTQPDGNFGLALALQGDTLVVGSPGEEGASTGVNGNQADASLSDAGAAYVFVRSSGIWVQHSYLKASNTQEQGLFGYALALSGDSLLVGTAWEKSNATGLDGDQNDRSVTNAGAAYYFKRNAGTWSQRHYIKAPVAASVDFGFSVALEGETAVIGAGGDSSNAVGINGNPAPGTKQSSGAVHVMRLAETFTLSVNTTGNGSVTGAGTHVAGSNVHLTATPELGHLFTGWSGDASGTENPLPVAMTSNKSITATFVPDSSDADADGLSAFLELTVYGTDPAKADTDDDGLTDGWEVGRGRYSIIEGSFTWAQARTDAQGRGGDLASFPTEDRWNRAMETLVPNAFDNYTGLWIGASDAGTEGTWTWVNGEPFSFSRWGTGRPSTAAGNTLDFAEMSGGAGAEIGKWYDRSPTTPREGYLLETGHATDPKVADADGDGLSDGAEQAAGSNPFLTDTDGDGLTDPQEINLTQTNPKLADTDNDGTSDALEDLDTDGLGNLIELTQHGTNPLLADTDGDSLNDGMEANYPGSYYQIIAGSFTYPQAAADAATKRGRVAAFPDSNEYGRVAAEARKITAAHLWIGLSDLAAEGAWKWSDASTISYTRWLPGQPDGGSTENQAVIFQGAVQWADAAANFTAGGYIFERPGLNPLAADTDSDGLTDAAEVNDIHSSPQRADSDDDGLSDGAEVNTHQTSPLLPDTDNDGLSDHAEVEVHHSNPNLKDSDGDGFDDLFEVSTGFDPALAASTPDARSTLLTAVEFRFNAANGASYRIEASADLLEWTIIENGIIGEGAVITRFYSTENQPTRYFRARRN